MDRREHEKKLLEELSCPESDGLIKPGVLLSDEIKRFVQQFKLIDPFTPDNLKPAGYELTVGYQYARGGEIRKLYDEPGKDEVKIPPFEVVIIQTKERVNMPRFLIARWNIRVKWAYEGLLWVGGPQVDPGYKGYLSCPLYNLSNKEVTLRVGNAIALIDFVTTTPFRKGQSREYPPLPSRLIFEDYNPEKLKSALYVEAREQIEEARKRVGEVETKLNRFETRADNWLGILLTIIAIFFAALTLFVSSSGQPNETYSWWVYVAVGFSIIAIAVSIMALSKSRLSRCMVPSDGTGEKLQKLERRLNISNSALIIVVIVIFWILIRI